MQRCVIVGGAEIRNPEFIKKQLLPDDYIIICDSGLMHLSPLGLTPDLIIGDFDSHQRPSLPCEIIVLPVEKDDTDTVYAIKEAVRRGFESFLLLGVSGGRLDHTLVNVSALLMLHERGLHAVLADDYSLMEIVGKSPVFVKGDCPYFSLLAISGPARGVTIRGAKYCLENAEILPSYQYGTGNEVLSGEKAEISVQDGCLLLMRIFRDGEKTKED